ncbi:indole-3-glycerol phosphate synthase, chloroplastic-like [Gossypium australe]|uniref:indole-3-glycerol-phosphate synthase n=2 Tax=Gossypium TaxID=3633 RepID=A0A5B6UQE7_9ROSI|nr:indole-3-glycerol phosphate synthase, chloroplastic-like [Gossypium australe]
MEGLVSMKTAPGISFQSIPSPNQRPNFFLRRSSMDLQHRRFHFPSIRAQQSGTIFPRKEDEEDSLKVKEWEVGMLQNEVAASQGIRIRRRPPSGPPLHYVGPFEFRLQNEGNTPRNILEEIVWHKDVEVSQMKEKKPLLSLKKVIENALPTRDFVGALKAAHLRTGVPGLIAEVKKASPSRGILRENFDPVKNLSLFLVQILIRKFDWICHKIDVLPPNEIRGLIKCPADENPLVEIARAYEKGGAACLSVLTDEKYFKGSFENLEAIRNAGVKCPLLCKEFVIDAWQIYYARIKGADAILLIAAVLPDLDIRYMIKICKMLGLAALVEVHDEREMDRVLGIEGIELIGINNRNLETFEVDISNTKKLLEGERGQMIRKKDIIVVGESGLFTPDDVAYVQEAGVKAVLVGESIVKQSDPGKGISGLFGKDISL